MASDVVDLSDGLYLWRGFSVEVSGEGGREGTEEGGGGGVEGLKEEFAGGGKGYVMFNDDRHESIGKE